MKKAASMGQRGRGAERSQGMQQQQQQQAW